MLTGVWNSVAGYVIIEIKGRGLERFLNLLLHSGIEIWRVRRVGASSVTACMDVAGFYALHKLAHGQNVRVRILEKHGLIMRLSRMRFRKVLLYGWVVILALLIAASRRIWFIEVEGCDVIQPADVLNVLDALDVRVGAHRTAVPTYRLGSAIMASDSRIAWAGAKLDGVTLHVSLTEAEPIPDFTLNPGTHASIFAKKDGVITGVTVYDGKALVHAGDAVIAGQELITGILRNDELNTLLTQARGEVIATVLYRFVGEAGPTVVQPVQTGQVRQGARISLLGWQLFSSGFKTNDWPEFDVVPVGEYSLTNCFLPLTAECMDMYELARREVAASEDILAEIAMERAEEAMHAALSQDARILSKESTFAKLENGAVQAQIIIAAEESIGELKEIEVPDGEQHGF